MIEVRLHDEPGPDGTATIVRVAGEVDLETSDQLASALAGCQGDVVVDLAGVVFMDSSGLAALVRARNRLTSEGGRLAVRDATDSLRRLFVITGLTDFLEH